MKLARGPFKYGIVSSFGFSVTRTTGYYLVLIRISDLLTVYARSGPESSYWIERITRRIMEKMKFYKDQHTQDIETPVATTRDECHRVTVDQAIGRDDLAALKR